MRAALLVIDLQNDFVERSPVLTASRPRIAAATNSLAHAFRSASLPVIWIRQEFAPDLHDALAEARIHKISIVIAGTRGSQLLPELQQGPDDLFVVKNRYSAFFRTDLDDLIAELRIERLVIAGINTHACVRTTALDAYQRDLDVVLAADCIASNDPEHHDVTLRYFQDKIARILPNPEIVRLISP